MKIKLDEHDISLLRSVRMHPGHSHYGRADDRLTMFGLVERCEEASVPLRRRQVKKLARELKKQLARVEWPAADTKRFADEKLRQQWHVIARKVSDMAQTMDACGVKGHRLTTAGSELLKSIDAAARAVKWTVDAKEVTLEIEA